MRYKDLIWLVSDQMSTDYVGNQVPIEQRRRVLANKYNVSVDAAFAASARGMDDIRVYEINAKSYQGEMRASVEVAGPIYKVASASTNGDRTTVTIELRSDERGKKDG